jgi:hypothetical protein
LPHAAATLPNQDSYSFNAGDVFPNFTNSGGGTWTEVAAVPEPSTRALLILGFAAIGFMTYRRRKSTIAA